MMNYTIKDNILDRDALYAFLHCASVIDAHGVEHAAVKVAYISDEDFKEERISGNHSNITGIVDFDTITGPGCYYEAGTNYLTDRIVLEKVVGWSDIVHGFSKQKKKLPSLDKLTNIRFVLYMNGEVDLTARVIRESATRFELCELFKQGGREIPTVDRGYELCLHYYFEGKDHNISIVNKTSDVPDEWYSWELDNPLVIACIADGVESYCSEYNDERLKSAEAGYTLTVKEYLEHNRK